MPEGTKLPGRPAPLSDPRGRGEAKEAGRERPDQPSSPKGTITIWRHTPRLSPGLLQRAIFPPRPRSHDTRGDGWPGESGLNSCHPSHRANPRPEARAPRINCASRRHA